MTTIWKKLAAAVLTVSLTLGQLPETGASPLVSGEGSKEERQRIALLLRVHGVDAAQANARVAVMTDQEVAMLAAEMDRQPAGGATPHFDAFEASVRHAQLAFLLAILAGLVVLAVVRAISQSFKQGRQS
ncbi:MAG TPA: DUF6627 family protein [Burkholderiales bacterium]